jgi:hypothetical protein
MRMQNTIPTGVVVILDCCYSGSAKISKGSEDDTAKIGRLILEEKSRKLPEGQGKYILSSSQSHQEAYALTTGEHSIFTYYLLKVLSGNSESIDSEEYVTPQSLGNYIIREITWGVNPEEAVLDGVFTLRTREDSSRLRARLASGPKHVLVIGGGFTGSEVASVCCELGLPAQSAMDAAQAAAQKAADDQAWEEKKPKKTAPGKTMAAAAGSLLPDRSLGLAQALAKLSRPLKIEVQSYPQS